MEKEDRQEDWLLKAGNWVAGQKAWIGLVLLSGIIGQAAESGWDAGMIAFGAMLFFGGLFFAGLLQLRRRRLRSETLSRNRFPGEPWRWRNPFDSPAISIDPWPAVGITWFLVLGWNSFIWPVAFEFYQRDLDLPEMVLIGIWPGLGIIGLMVALRNTQLALRFGRVWVDLAEVPFQRGGLLRATLRARLSQTKSASIEARLYCRKYRWRHRGDKSSLRAEVLYWQHHAIPLAEARRTGRFLAVPVCFELPRDVAETAPGERRRERIEWSLEFSGPAGFRAETEVPVHGLSAQSSDVVQPDPAAPAQETLDEVRMQAALARAGISLRDSDAGELIVNLPVSTQGKGGLFLGLGLLLIAAAWWLSSPRLLGDGGLFVLMMALASLAMAFYTAFGTLHWRISDSELARVVGCLGWHDETVLQKDQIRGLIAYPSGFNLDLELAVTRGDATASNEFRGQWQVLAMRNGDDNKTLVECLPDRDVARALIAVVERRLGDLERGPEALRAG